MRKNIIIVLLGVIAGLSLYKLNATESKLKAIQIAPNVTSIDWAEELYPLIADDSVFVGTIEFKMSGPNHLEVGFYHNYANQ